MTRAGHEHVEPQRKAEDPVLAQTTISHPPRTKEAILKIVRELEAHQLELEARNLELSRSKEEAEAALQKYADLYDFAPVGYLTLDRNGIIHEINISGAALLGNERSLILGRRFVQFVVPKDRHTVTSFIGTVFNGFLKLTSEATLLHKGQQARVVQLEAQATASGQECRLALIDITERKRIEIALRESEDRMYRLTEMAADAIIMLDHSGAVTFCNAAAERMFGSPRETINRCNFHESFIPEQFRATAKQGFDRFREHGVGPLIGSMTEVTALRKDGTEFPVELSISALSIKGVWHAIAIMRDATERKKTEKEVQDAREYAESIVETVRRPLVVLDADLKILSANQNFYNSFRVSPEETLGHEFPEIGNQQWNIPRLLALLEGLLRDNAVFNSYEVEHDFPGVGRKVILLNARRIFRKNSVAPNVLLAMEDITQRKLADERISEIMRQQQAILDNIPNIAWLKDR